MLTAISRYGVRLAPETEDLFKQCEAKGELIEGPHIAQFERAFEARLGAGTAIATSYGRMAFYHMVKALDLPPGCAFRARCAHATEVCAVAPDMRPMGASGQAGRCHHPLGLQAQP